MNPLPLQSTIDQYRQQAAALDPSFNLPGWYHFEDWPGLANFAQAAADENSPVFQFESAADAIVAGDTAALTSAISKNPDLVHARSTRIHRGTLLHYIAANGVEQYRQKTPPNAVEIATILLKNGAPVDATANMYGAPSTTMAMLVSSVHPAQAGRRSPPGRDTSRFRRLPRSAHYRPRFRLPPRGRNARSARREIRQPRGCGRTRPARPNPRSSSAC